MFLTSIHISMVTESLIMMPLLHVYYKRLYIDIVLEHDKLQHSFQYRKGLAVEMGQPCPKAVKNRG